MSDNTVSEILERVIEIAEEQKDTDLQKWAHLELEGYYSTNRYLSQDDEVPDYREIAGEHRDIYGRPLVIKDSRFDFVNIDRLRASVTEIEEAAKKEGFIRVRDAQKIEIIKTGLGVDVSEFVFSPIALKGVLTSIKEEAIRRTVKYVTRKELLAGTFRQEAGPGPMRTERSKPTRTAGEDGASKYGTLGWLWHNLPITVWFKFLGFLVFVFLLGVYVSGIPMVRDLLSYVPGYKSEIPSSPETRDSSMRGLSPALAPSTGASSQSQIGSAPDPKKDPLFPKSVGNSKVTESSASNKNSKHNSPTNTSASALAPSTGASSQSQIGSAPDPKKDPLFPKLVGNNVEFPAMKLERSTPRFKPGDKFYIAIDDNGWDPETGDERYEMERKGDKLIAKGVINQRFHPVLVAPREWHQIESAYPAYLPKKGEFKNNIDYTYPRGPCYCFGPNCVPYSQGGR